MHRHIMILASLVSLALVGCGRRADLPGDAGAGHGRYSAGGIYAPESQWRHLVAAQGAGDPGRASNGDDQAIIVVIDSATGEYRACGDLSGFCISHSPWKAAMAPSQQAPVAMTAHPPYDGSTVVAAPPAKPAK